MKVFHARSKRGAAVGVLAASMLASVLGMAPAAHAAVPHPCNAHDLRDAVNADAPNIVLNKKCKYKFTSADWANGDENSALTVDTDMTIWGNGATIEIGGHEAFRHFFIDGVDLRLNNLTLKGGSQKSPFSDEVSEAGGALAAGSILVVDGGLVGEKLTVRDNEVTAVGGTVAAYAGGILAFDSMVELIKSTVKDNEVNAYGVTAEAAGGGIVNLVDDTGELVLDRSTVKNNEVNASSVVLSVGAGGGIADQDDLVMSNSTVSGNKVTAKSGLISLALGGGIYLPSGTHKIDESEIKGNKATAKGPVSIAAGGGILNSGSLEVDFGATGPTGKTTTIKDNKVECESEGFCLAAGGGYAGLDSTADFGTTLFKGNKAEADEGAGAGGGIAVADSTTYLEDVTVTKNTAKGDVALGGGIANFGDTTDVDIDSSDIYKNKPTDCYNVFGC